MFVMIAVIIIVGKAADPLHRPRWWLGAVVLRHGDAARLVTTIVKKKTEKEKTNIKNTT